MSVQTKKLKFLFIDLTIALLDNTDKLNGVTMDNLNRDTLQQYGYSADKVKLLEHILENSDYRLVTYGETSVNDFIQNTGFQQSDKIVGTIISKDHVSTVSVYDDMDSISSVTIPLGSRIKHWIDNFAIKPYNIHKSLKRFFEVWETNEVTKEPEFKGMKSLVVGKDLDYVIITHKTDEILGGQLDRCIMINAYDGITNETAKEILLK